MLNTDRDGSFFVISGLLLDLVVCHAWNFGKDTSSLRFPAQSLQPVCTRSGI